MDIDLGPLGILYCWQSCVIAFLITTLTHGVKRLIDYNMGGKETRQQSLLINSIILPATPITLGALLGVLLPLHPEELIKYMADHNITGFKAQMVFAAYGAAMGQFADYVWARYSSVVDGMKAKAAQAAAAAPAAPAPALPAETPAAPVAPVPVTAPAEAPKP